MRGGRAGLLSRGGLFTCAPHCIGSSATHRRLDGALCRDIAGVVPSRAAVLQAGERPEGVGMDARPRVNRGHGSAFTRGQLVTERPPAHLDGDGDGRGAGGGHGASGDGGDAGGAGERTEPAVRARVWKCRVMTR